MVFNDYDKYCHSGHLFIVDVGITDRFAIQEQHTHSRYSSCAVCYCTTKHSPLEEL